MLNKDSKIVIFGGSGFLGENILNYLTEKGHNSLTIINREEIKTEEAIAFDLETDSIEKISKYLEEADFIFNLTFPKNFEFNLDKKILDFCYGKNKDAIHVFFGSSMQYDSHEEILSEGTPLNGDSEYGFKKNKLEKFYRDYNEKGLPIIFLRLSNPYGYSTNFFEKNTMDTYLFSGINEGKITISMANEIFRDMIYIDDFVDVFYKIISCVDSIGETFNVGSGEKTSIGEIIDFIKENFPNVKFEYKLKKNNRSFVFDISKIKDKFNWKPRYSYKEGFLRIAKKLKL